MRKSLLRALFPGLLSILLLTAGCVPIPAQTGVSTAPTTAVTATTAITPTTAITATVPVTATSAVTSTATVTPTAAISATSVATATTPLSPTAEVSTSIPPGATEAVTPASASESAGGRSVTLEDEGKTITLRPGERFLLNLGEGYDWEVTIANQNVVSRVIGVLTIRGSQGLFEARQAGTTTLSAAGNPTCLSAQPPCAMPSRSFQVELTVTQ